MEPHFLKIFILLAFLFIQIFSFGMVFVMRYHFRLFAVPDDRRTKTMLRLLIFGTLFFFFVALVLVYLNFNTDFKL